MKKNNHSSKNIKAYRFLPYLGFPMRFFMRQMPYCLGVCHRVSPHIGMPTVSSIPTNMAHSRPKKNAIISPAHSSSLFIPSTPMIPLCISGHRTLKTRMPHIPYSLSDSSSSPSLMKQRGMPWNIPRRDAAVSLICHGLKESHAKTDC